MLIKSVSTVKPSRKQGLTALVHLGRFGDIIVTLPIAKDLADKSGHPTPWFVAKPYASIMDGVSYVKPEIYPMKWTYLDAAVKTANVHYQRVIVPRHWGGLAPRVRAEGYDRATWQAAGYLDRWGTMPLVFDRRCPDREAELISRYCKPGRPTVLVNCEGFSSPLDSKQQVLSLMESMPGINLVNIGSIKAHRIYDLLGLMDAAQLLVTIDTSTLHLAKASSIPTIALIAGSEFYWGSSTPQCNCILKVFYGQVPSSLDLIRSTTVAALGLKG